MGIKVSGGTRREEGGKREGQGRDEGGTREGREALQGDPLGWCPGNETGLGVEVSGEGGTREGRGTRVTRGTRDEGGGRTRAQLTPPSGATPKTPMPT
jgi:hypothetical protein